MPNKILVPIELADTAKVIFQSPLRSGTADNDKNTVLNEVTVVDWVYLGDTSTTAWYIIDTEQAQLLWFWRNKAEFKEIQWSG